jgi:hypothetical protein
MSWKLQNEFCYSLPNIPMRARPPKLLFQATQADLYLVEPASLAQP